MSHTESSLSKHWPAFSRQLDLLLDLPPAERASWLAAQDLDPDLKHLLADALATDARASPLDVSAIAAREPAARESEPWRRQLGVWRILRPLGEGGSASVFLAERSEGGFRQEAALKLLRSGVLDPLERARFAYERELLAGLRHPGIARLIDGGVSPEGAPYLVIDYVDGEAITTWCARAKLPLDARLALFQSACEAVHYAHRNLIVHRDLKPGNIMVDVDGHVKLLDFGIARLLDDGRTQTRTEARRLTPAYAAPEQVDGGAVTTAIDVYAMGVLLHELVTGELPSQIGKFGAARSAPRYRWVDAGPVDRGLIAIIENAIEPDPEQRYASIAALAEDVERYRNGLTVRARGTSRWYRLRRSLRRHWGVVSAASLVLCVVSIAALIAQREATVARQVAEREAATRAFLVDLLTSASPENVAGKPVDLAELVALGAERAQTAFPDAPIARAELLYVSGRLLNSLGRYEQAERTLRQALAIELGIAPWQTYGRPETRLALVHVLRDRNRPSEAMDMLSPLVQEMRADPGARAVLGQALILEGTMRSRAGEEVKGIALLEEGLGILRRQPGISASVLNDSERQLGDALARAGRSIDALPVWRSALNTAPDHTLLRSRLLLSIGYAEQRRGGYEAARAAMSEALAIQQLILPKQHTDTSQTLTALAVLEAAIGRDEQALARHREALQMREQLFGIDSVESGESQIAVAVSLHALDRMAESFEAFRAGITRLERCSEPQLERQAWAWTNYAAALRKGGRIDEAVQAAERSVSLMRPVFPADSETRLSFELEWVHALRTAKRFDEAEAQIANAERVAQHPVLRRRYQIAKAEIARDRGQLTQAINEYRIITDSTPPALMPIDHAEAWRGLANVHRLAGDADRANAARARSLELFAVFLPPGHPRWQKLRSE